MAEDKNTVVVYADWMEKFEELTDEEAGRLIKHFFRYVNDLDPEYPDRTTKIAFLDIKNSLKRDLSKWEAIKKKRSEAGKASAEARKAAKEAEQKSTNSTHVESVQQTSTKSTVSVNVNDSVTVSVNDIIINYELDDFHSSILNDILKFFNYTESKFINQQKLAASFVSCMPFHERSVFFKEQFEFYKRLKTLDGYRHSFENFIGDQSEQFKNGKWNDNWQEKLKQYEVKNGMAQPSNAPVKRSSLAKALERQKHGEVK